MSRKSAKSRTKGSAFTAKAKVAEPALARPARYGYHLRANPREALESAILERTRSLLTSVVASAPDSLLSRALGESSAAGTMAVVLSELPSPPTGINRHDLALAAARARGTNRKMQLLEQAGGALTGAELARLLDISRQAISEGRNRNLYFAVPVGDRMLFPRFQLTESGILKGLREFLSAFTIQDPWAQLLVLLSPLPRLGRRSPLEALQQGDTEAAVRVAAQYGEHGG